MHTQERLAIIAGFFCLSESREELKFLNRFKKNQEKITFKMSVEQVEDYARLKNFAEMVMNERSISFVTKQKLKAQIGKENFGELYGKTLWIGKHNANI